MKVDIAEARRRLSLTEAEFDAIIESARTNGVTLGMPHNITNGCMCFSGHALNAAVTLAGDIPDWTERIYTPFVDGDTIELSDYLEIHPRWLAEIGTSSIGPYHANDQWFRARGINNIVDNPALLDEWAAHMKEHVNIIEEEDSDINT